MQAFSTTCGNFNMEKTAKATFILKKAVITCNKDQEITDFS